jgi:predicted MFS family arabinose efflux permease
MSRRTYSLETKHQRMLFLSALVFAVTATTIIDVTTPLLLTDIAKTFQIQVGTAGNIRSSSAIAGVIFGLITALVSVKLNPKSLLLTGLFCECIAALGSYLAPSIGFMYVAFFFDGVGSVIVAAMAYSLIAEYYPSEQRSKAIGLVVAAGSFTYVFASPIIGWLGDVGGWREATLWFVLPATAASLPYAFLFLPWGTKESGIKPKKHVFEGCRKTFSNRSATFCLIGVLLFYVTSAVSVYVVSYWKIQFLIGNEYGAITIIVNSIIGALASLAAGLMVIRTGRKRLGLTAAIAVSVLVAATFLMTSFYLSWEVSMVRMVFWGLATAAFISLSVEQVAKFPKSMMSLFGAFSGIGSLLGATFGGMVINLFGFQAFGLFLCGMGITSAIVIFPMVKDPNNSVLGINEC